MSQVFIEHNQGKARAAKMSVKITLPFIIIGVYYRTSIYAAYLQEEILIGLITKGLTSVKLFLCSGSGEISNQLIQDLTAFDSLFYR